MHELLNAFCFFDPAALSGAAADADRYASIVGWAGRARGTNPNAFDAMTDLLLDDAAWTPEALPASAAAFSDLLGLFRGQTARLRECLRALEPSGLVNAAVFPALDRLESALNGDLPDLALKDAVARACADPAALRDRRVRELLAGGRTGPAGTASVDYFGYLNLLKDCDAGVQWTLFMPDVVRRQQDGFRVSHFSYKKMPAMRFVGFEGDVDDETRAAYIAKNPDYGVIVCRCEEISRGEILDALRSNVCVPTVDGVKKRVRPGMGRCQGGFCSPQVVRIIAEFLGVPLSEVRKSSADAPITFGPTKSGEVQA